MLKSERYLQDLKKRAKNLNEYLEVIAERSDELCPKDTGALVNSRKIENNAIIYDTPYASIVHEDLQTRHPNGEAKFLEKATNEKKDELLRKIVRG